MRKREERSPTFLSRSLLVLIRTVETVGLEVG